MNRKAYYREALRLTAANWDAHYSAKVLAEFERSLYLAGCNIIRHFAECVDRAMMAAYNRTGGIYGGGIASQCPAPSTSLTATPLSTEPSMPLSPRLAYAAQLVPGGVVVPAAISLALLA